MQSLLRNLRLGAATLAVAIVLAGTSPNFIAVAQTTPPPAATSVALSEPVIKALQEALNRQGIAVKADGVLSDETRAAIRKYQSQHHLPVSGEPDKATLDKLGIADRRSATPAQPLVLAQATPTPPAGSPSPQAQAQIQPAPQGPMQPGQMQGGMMMNCPMMQGTMQGMMQMMQGMMQMMQMMQGQTQPGQTQPGQMQPGQMQPGQMQPGQMQPGQMQPGAR